MTRKNSKSRDARVKRRKPEKLEFVQPFLPVRDIQNGIVETTDGRYVKILEIEPINFMLRSSEEQYLSHGLYIGADSQCKPDWKVISAIWVLLRFIDKIEPVHHRRGNYPAQVFFLKEGIGYEILVISQGDEYCTRLLKPQENQKYILVVPDLQTAKRIWLPEAPCLFAVLHTIEGEDVPEIKFYTPEMIKNGK